MTVTININNLTLCHRGSNGITHNTLPDICKTPDKAIPRPFDNEAYSKDLANGTTTVFADKGNMIANFGSIFAKSSLDGGGSFGGIKSGTFLAEADFITHSFDVFFEGKPACRLTDKMWMNHRNTVNMAGLNQITLPADLMEKICIAICECRKKFFPSGTQIAEATEDIFDVMTGSEDMTRERPSAVNAPHRRQACFAAQFNKSGYAWIGTIPKDPKVLTEVPYRIPTNLITSETGRTTFSGGPVAPASVRRVMNKSHGNKGTIVIWDMVTVKNASLPATWDNVDKIVEIKFAGDDWTENQLEARKSSAVEDKLIRVDEADCACDLEENEQRRKNNKLAKEIGESLKKASILFGPPGLPGLPGLPF
ncbi:DUF4150 domain-containing protein [Massilia aquatica]|uniref:DUF4150 domain-containing protein n=1 Tax=Massilia aquatica TaxID=2609000 RepID=A0ABX0LWW6_9BURK|nr:DUF4150 domain-containing protein [Massilia aquatica]NHZ38963.1 DUF4150 domain-containing protein [Massilia aquatica]